MSTSLPDRTNGTTGIVDAATTSGQQKTNLGTLRDFIADLFGTTTAALRTVWEAFRLHSPATLHNASLTFSVGSSALTLALKTRAGATPSATDPVLIGQRSATAGNGDFNLRAVTAATSLVVSSGSTLGLGNSDSTAVYVYAIDNAGTIELAISQTWLGPSGITTTTAEGGAGAADSAAGIYSTTARSNVPFRAIAKLAVPQTTAGTYAAVPTSCQLWPFDQPVSAAPANVTVGTSQATTSGTSIDFTSIPSGVKRIVMMLNGVSISGTANLRIQLGDSGGVETSGYSGSVSAGAGVSNFTSGFDLDFASASAVVYGQIIFSLCDASNTWIASGLFVSPATSSSGRSLAGVKQTSATLDRVRLTTSNGTDTFDAGAVNIQYES